MNAIQINSTQVDNALAELARRTSHLQPAFNAIGQALKTNIDNSFRNHQSPDGINWAALSPVTKMNRAERVSGGKKYTSNGRHTTAKFTRAYLSAEPLNDTGKLKNSFTVNAGETFVEVGTNAQQAALMNFGGTKAEFPNLWGDIPARPFMPTEQLPALWQDEILAVIRQHLEL